MATTPIDYGAVLADLEAKKAQIESAIEAIRLISGMSTSPNPTGSGGAPEPHAFLGMSIPEATKVHLASTRRKQSTQDIMTALEAGGLPSSKYSTVYAVLRRREAQVGDIINIKGDWGLAEWYPNYRKPKASKDAEESQQQSEQPEPDAAEPTEPIKSEAS